MDEVQPYPKTSLNGESSANFDKGKDKADRFSRKIKRIKIRRDGSSRKESLVSSSSEKNLLAKNTKLPPISSKKLLLQSPANIPAGDTTAPSPKIEDGKSGIFNLSSLDYLPTAESSPLYLATQNKNKANENTQIFHGKKRKAVALLSIVTEDLRKPDTIIKRNIKVSE